jgi:hypothetical protein
MWAGRRAPFLISRGARVPKLKAVLLLLWSGVNRAPLKEQRCSVRSAQCAARAPMESGRAGVPAKTQLPKPDEALRLLPSTTSMTARGVCIPEQVRVCVCVS